MVRAKFKCHGVTKRTGFNGHEFVYDAEMSPVVGNGREGNEENDKFYAATPGGKISIVSAAVHFEPGKTYYVDFTPAD
jgi:hypothetical protein